MRVHSIDGRLVLSPSDLTGFLACRRLSELDRAAAAGEREAPVREDPELAVLRRRGAEHERGQVAALHAGGTEVVEIGAPDGPWSAEALREAERRTREAMCDGVAAIAHGVFFDGRWVGVPDLLERVEQPSDLGPFGYEVADCKLARRVRPGALLQLASYARHLARIQGRTPDRIHVLLGDGTRASHRLEDVAAYHRRVAAEFEEAVEADAEIYPEPVSHCRMCRWQDVCGQRWREDDHLSLVAGMAGGQREKLRSAGIDTVSALAAAGEDVAVEGIGRSTLDRLRQQARLQIRERETGRRHYQLLEPAPGEGLALLPPPSPGDLFFDIEGDPFVGAEGREYLFGFVEQVAGGGHTFHPFWGHGETGERRAFQQAVDLIIERLERHPEMHVYHYAPYEEVALKRLAGRHATREEEVDRILRGEVLVDLYRVVRQGLRVSAGSYSLKALEPLYMQERQTSVADGASSIVAYEDWLDSGDGRILDDIADYNEDDCISTRLLRDWLEQRRNEVEALFDVDVPRPEPGEEEVSEELTQVQEEVAALQSQLLEGVPATADDRTAEEQARWLLAHLLEWHRREEKSFWWRYFTWIDMTDEEATADPDLIGGLSVEGEIGRVKRSRLYAYTFDPRQEFTIGEGATVHSAATDGYAGTVHMLDEEGRIVLKTTRGPDEAHPTSLVPHEWIDDRGKRAAIRRRAAEVAADGMSGEGPSRALQDLLLRRPPRVPGQGSGRSLRREDEDAVPAATRLVSSLDRSCLPIQGPPGAGKTYSAGRVIVDLIRDGRRVGVTALSHEAIGNLLAEACGVAEDQGVAVRALQKPGAAGPCDAPAVTAAGNDEVEAALAAGDVDLVAGTAWLFSRPGLESQLDVLVVDEASQLPLADAVAVVGAADSIVLVGDPQQLSQPSRGVHPPGAGVSALDHLLGEHATLPDDRGLFLGTTHRLHPAICAFTSGAVYEGRLDAAPVCDRRRVGGDGALGGAGVRYVPVDHVGCRIESQDEAEAVAGIVEDLTGRPWIDGDGARPLRPTDIIVVAPYNAQVAVLRASLPDGVRVGTVDKFQGQEAPVAIYSMTTSSAEEIPRAMEFLYSLDRLNVATSRAQALSIIVASPALLKVRCHRADQVRLANALCRYVEVAAEQVR